MAAMNGRQTRTKRRGRPVAVADGDMRERLLDAATTLFAERGVAVTPMGDIAARVGVTSAMIHYYFKSRERLLDVVVEERVGRFIAVVVEGIDEMCHDPLAMVQGLVTRIIRAVETMPWLPSLWIREIAADGGLLRERLLQRLPVDSQKRFGDCIVEGQRKGVVNPDLHPYLLFVSIIGQSLFPLAVANIWKRFPTLDKLGNDGLIRHANSLLMFGVAGSASGAKSNGRPVGRMSPC